MIGRIMAVSGEEHPVASPLPGEYLLAKNVCSDDPSITLPWSVVVHEDGRAAAVYIDVAAEVGVEIPPGEGGHGILLEDLRRLVRSLTIRGILPAPFS